MNISDLMQKLRAIENNEVNLNEALTLSAVAQAEKTASDAAAAKKAQGGMGSFLSLDPKTAGNAALAQLAQQNGLPGLFNSAGEFVVAQGDAEWSSKPNAPRTAPPNKDDQMALQNAGLIPGNAEGPSGLVNALTGGGAKKEFDAAKAPSAMTNATNTSNEFIKTKLGELKALVDQLKGSKAPVAESVKISAKLLAESMGYDLEEGGITLPNADGSMPPGAFTADDQVKLNQKMSNVAGNNNLVEKIKAVMAELADIEDPAVQSALADAQAAIDAASPASAAPVADKKKDRERLQQLIDITKKPPVAQNAEMEESLQPLSEGEKMANLKSKLLLLERSLGEAPRMPRLPNFGSAEKGAETLPKVIGSDVAKVDPIWKIDQTGPKTINMGKADVVDATPKSIGGPKVPMSPSEPGFDFKKAAQIAAGTAAVGGAAYLGSKDKAAPAQSGQAAPTAPQSSDYTVQRGDTLSALAKKNGVSVADIMKANPSIKDPNKIMAGATLKMPVATGNPVYQGGVGSKPAAPTAPTAPAAGGASKTNLTKFYADEMKEMEELIGRNKNDPEMADIVKAAQAQLDSLKATAQ